MSIEERALRNEIESYLRGEHPPASKLEAAPKLDDWMTVFTRAPGGGYCMLVGGVVTGHPMLPDGKETYSDEIVWLDRYGRFARSKKGLWRLGETAGTDGVAA